MTTVSNATEPIRAVPCPACGHHVAVPFFDGGLAPLATLAWPTTPEQARALGRLPLDFVRCVECGHVFNAAFDYAAVPYADRPNRMFNRAPGWTGHLRTMRDEILARVPAEPVVVEIGHGDGHFLVALAEARPRGRYIGFDPHGSADPRHRSVELRAMLFDPDRNVADLRPDLIVSRHVLEHLTNPLGFIQALSFASASAAIQPALYLEVPCVDRAVETGRTFDFYYEHNSHFTTASLMRMLSRCDVTNELVGHGYHGEVLYAFVRLGGNRAQVDVARAARAFHHAAQASLAAIRRQMDALAESGRTVAIWGGTGKAAAFIVQAGADAERFPIVVDSDADKVGTFVPGAGQQIRPREWLRAHPVDVIVIPAQWRARDIVREIAECGLACPSILIEFHGCLVDYFTAAHPYRDGHELPAAAHAPDTCEARR